MNMKLYSGCVEDRFDPLKLGRCRVRVVGLHTDDKTELPTKDLPWAFPVLPITEARVSGIGQSPLGPVEGTWILIVFRDDEQQQPIMLGTLGGVPQSNESAGELTIKEVEPSGATVSTSSDSNVDGSDPKSESTTAETTTTPAEAVTEKGKIVGPLAVLIAKGESGSAGYNAFNRGSSAPKGTGSIGGQKLDLINTPIKDIMAKQALPSGSAEKLFAVGKYQCIPDTLKAACTALNIDINSNFTETTQDIICQEYLVARKRPPLVAYYKGSDKNDETLLKNAGKALAAEFASIEDPYFPGFPYGGEQGTYYRVGKNKVHTTWDTIKPMLIAEWEFRNGKTPTATATIADGHKVEKGSDYQGVAKAIPEDTSLSTPPSKDSKVTPIKGLLPTKSSSGGLFGIGGQYAGVVSSIADKTGLSGIVSDITSEVTGAISTITKEVNGVVTSVTADINTAISDVTSEVSSALSGLGDSIGEVATSLGLEDFAGSLSDLATELGLPNATPAAITAELTKLAGTTAGQAQAILNKVIPSDSLSAKALPVGAKNPDGTISNGTGVNPTKGFQDPNGTYPKNKDEPDTNRLATNNNIGPTIVLQKEAAMKSGVKVANGGTWDQSPVPYNAQYPFNHVKQTESGHVMEFDDTKGSERVHIYHKAGSFIEWDANGTQVNRIVGDGFEIYERNGYVYVKGALNVTVDGALNLRTDNVFNLEVSGAANINIYNNANVNVSGDTNLAVGGVFNLKANKINIESAGEFNIKAATGLNFQSGADLNIKSGATTYIDAVANFNMLAGGSAFLQTTEDINFKSAGKLFLDGSALNMKSSGVANIQAASKMSLLATGILAIDASVIDMQDGNSSSADNAAAAQTALPAGQADIELPIETRGTSGASSMPALSVPTRSSETSFETPTSGGAASAYIANRVSNNDTSSTSIAQPKVVTETAAPKGSSGGAVTTDDSAIKNMDSGQFTAGMKLSKNFTLGDLTKGGVRIPKVTYNLPSRQGGPKDITITPQQIVANLKALCENVLEPIAEKYGKDSFVITSGFRRGSTGPNDAGDLGFRDKAGNVIPEWGDHVTGCAVDISFKGGKAKTFEVVKDLPTLLKSWNQIIMEYDKGGASYWFHVAYKQSGNAGHCFTMNSHAVYAGTFPTKGFVLV